MSNQQTPDSPAHCRPRQARRVRLLVLIPGIALLLLVLALRAPIRNWLLTRVALASDAPSAETLEQVIAEATDPCATILEAWTTGKIVQREVAIRMLPRIFPAGHVLPENLHTMLLAGALDPDTDVRERALSYLEERRDPALPALAAAQLDDVDPQLRLLGLQYLKRVPGNAEVPILARLLGDEDPRVVAMSIRLLEDRVGEHFGVKLADSVQVADPKTGLEEFRAEGVARIRDAAGRAAVWWASHRADYAPVHLEIPPAALAGNACFRAADFSLPTLDGHLVRLSQFRGHVVLINFWTTWCTACLSEMPELVALHNRHGEHPTILGVSLDFVSTGENSAQLSSEDIRRKIERVVKARNINYSVLLDETGSVGGRFNGGELPTTVIVDAQGYVRRRFIGARSLEVFEAMIATASQPAGSLREVRQAISLQPEPRMNTTQRSRNRRVNHETRKQARKLFGEVFSGNEECSPQRYGPHG